MMKIGVKFLCGWLLFAGALFAQQQPEPTASDSTALSATVPRDTLVQTDTTQAEKTPAKIAVAVLKLDPNGITDSEARALSDRLRIEIFNAGVYEVMEREKMNRILDEMQFQLSGCTSDECVIEIGRLIGVQKMIAGSISKVGEFYTVSTRLIDVNTGKIEATAIEDIEGTLGIVLTQAIPSIAKKISGLAGIEIQPKQETALKINTEPVFAEVFINGGLYGESPLEIALEAGKEYHLRVKKEGYESLEKQFTLDKNQILDMNIILSKTVEKEEPVREVPKSRKRDYHNGFRIKFVQSPEPHVINDQIQEINNLIHDHNQLFKQQIPAHNQFSEIETFNGVEVYNVTQAADNLAFEFGLGIYRQDLDKWVSDLGDNKGNQNYSLVTWSPQISLNLRLAPIRYPLFYPYIDAGFGYNCLIMTAYHEEESLGGPVYQSWGFSYGLGLEIRPLKILGVSLEWYRKNMDMRLMDVDKVTDHFDFYDLNRINLTGNRIAASLNLYY